MQLNFTKMQGCGNDFVVIDNTTEAIELSAEQARTIADRRYGIGCDQILLVGSHPDDGIDFSYRILNADGGEVNACGNGARCFALFVHQQGLSDKNTITVATAAGRLILELHDDESVTVNMGAPEFETSSIPLDLPQADLYKIDNYEFAAVSMGNPHAVLDVSDVDKTAVTTIGSYLETHASFPKHANIGFRQITGRQQIKLRVHERGVGETLACGTGACAAVVTGIQSGLLDSPVRVTLAGGELTIEWQGESHPVMMTGPAETVYQGTIEL